jgi:proline racemase
MKLPEHSRRIRVIDSHTEGEPTRVVIDGGPELGSGGVDERLTMLRDRYDPFRSAVVNEPRGSDVMVGAFLVPPRDPRCVAGVIFFNNVGYLGMCGHGTIGVIVTLAYLGKIRCGQHRLETPVGEVTATLHANGGVSVKNVVSWRREKDVAVEVPGLGRISGDVAWGGNWFFLAEAQGAPLDLSRVDELSNFAWRLRQAVHQQGFPEVDHVELFGTPRHGGNSRNFVLCPGKAYDRSPCGTGTSAKLACLAADGKLREGEAWLQEGILGTVFEGRFEWSDRQQGRIMPVITGTAHVTADSTLLLDEADPFCWGIRQ